MTNHEEPSVYYSSLESRFLAREGVDLRRSVRSPALAYRGSIFAFHSGDGLVVKVGTEAATSAITAGDGLAYWTSPAHVSPTWLLVPFDPSDPHRWAHFVERAYEHSWAEAEESGGTERD